MLASGAQMRPESRAMQHLDKLAHFAAGFALALTFGVVHPALGLAVAAFVGWAKERYDRGRPDRHTHDGWDAFVTVAGAIPAQVVLAFWPELRELVP
jgi:hypothetical protein